MRIMPRARFWGKIITYYCGFTVQEYNKGNGKVKEGEDQLKMTPLMDWRRVPAARTEYKQQTKKTNTIIIIIIK